MTLRSISTELKDHLDKDATTMASCWRITRKDGQVFRFTDSDIPIRLSDGEYSPIDSGKASAIEDTVDITTNNLSVQQILSSESITIEDLNAGLFDWAGVDIYWVNYKNPSQGTITLFSGFFGEVKMRDDVDFEVELKSLATKLEQTIGRRYTQQCDVEELGDSRCGLDITAHTYSCEVTSITDNQTFTAIIAAPDDTYTLGSLTWITGNNAGESVAIQSQIGSQIILSEAMPLDIQEGDEYQLLAEEESLSDYTLSGTVTSITDNQIFSGTISGPNGYYKYSKITWISGNNESANIEVKSQSDNKLVLFLPMAYTIQVGDEFDLFAGCDRYFETCKNKFNNIVNFRGFPHIPGRDSISRYPDANN